MFSESHIELEPGYQYTARDAFVDRCYLFASIGMLVGLIAGLLKG